jgi:type IV secretory pathway VirB6-like protein
MNKPATLIATALLTFGFAAASMAADAPKAGADSTTASKPAKSHKASKSHKKAATAPATSK